MNKLKQLLRSFKRENVIVDTHPQIPPLFK